MIVPRLALIVALCTSPASAQDLSPSSAASSDTSSATTPRLALEAPSSPPQTPRGLTDPELEMAVRAAYGAAAGFASSHGNYFARDGVVPPLRDAIAAAIASAYPAVVVPADAFADLEAASTCLAAPGAELRLATNIYGDGITLVAVTEARLFAYDYDPHKEADIKVVAATDCIKPK